MRILTYHKRSIISQFFAQIVDPFSFIEILVGDELDFDVRAPPAYSSSELKMLTTWCSSTFSGFFSDFLQDFALAMYQQPLVIFVASQQTSVLIFLASYTAGQMLVSFSNLSKGSRYTPGVSVYSNKQFVSGKLDIFLNPHLAMCGCPDWQCHRRL